MSCLGLLGLGVFLWGEIALLGMLGAKMGGLFLLCEMILSACIGFLVLRYIKGFSLNAFLQQFALFPYQDQKPFGLFGLLGLFIGAILLIIPGILSDVMGCVLCLSKQRAVWVEKIFFGLSHRHFRGSHQQNSQNTEQREEFSNFGEEIFPEDEESFHFSEEIFPEDAATREDDVVIEGEAQPASKAHKKNQSLHKPNEPFPKK